ncbi:phage tail tube protein [Pimelobacter simplex]|uniref:phage tail tube protein n=1 Tax=Nocardioides simplex TaxID=2045 RepID=UPI0021506530|nr:phage tail tube protein [Pimelobacter simplex]UUW87400.1 phage tail tube protein [Pimelobacter simplex]UUW96905.1 phage tail tube protein [Pimelobacter simplex]
MVTGTGLDAQLGYKPETAVGTEVTVDKFLEFNSEGFEFDPSWIEPEGLRVGTKFKRGSRLVQSRKQVSGSVELNYATRLMGGLWKLAVGSTVTTPTLIAGSAYKQVHQTGDLLGKSATFQVGRPEPATQVVRAHTIRGCKCTSWEFSVGDNEVAKLKLELDGWDESTSTALAVASYPYAEELNFSQCTAFTLGATIAGTTEFTATGGTPVSAIVNKLTIKGDNALATERYGLGNAGLKKEQLENGIPTITGSFDAEYSKSEFYDPFKAGTATSLLIRFEGTVLSGTDKNTLEFIAPEIRIKKSTPTVEGPDIVKATVEFEVYANGTLNPFQVKVISGDSTAI